MYDNTWFESRLIVMILYGDVDVKSMKIIISHIFLLEKCSTCIYLIGFYAFQSAFFATIYNNM